MPRIRSAGPTAAETATGATNKGAAATAGARASAGAASRAVAASATAIAPDVDQVGEASLPLDVTAESEADRLGGLADRVAQRAELMLVARRLKDQDRQTDIDRIHAEFDAHAAERAEYLRQMNVLRDMAMEQQKHDDEILKKWITLI